MTSFDARRSLHRLTPLRDDPAAAWLTPPQRMRVLMTGVFGWIVFSVVMNLMFWAQVVLMANLFSFASLRVAAVVTTMTALALVWPVRRMIMRRKAAKTADLVRTGSPSIAVAVDDFGELERQADGAVVSLVGWIRAGVQLSQLVGGDRCIGLALACHQRYPGVLETLHDFELIDEAGRAVSVHVADARMLGDSNVNLTDGGARMMLIASLNLPVGAVATGWDAFVLRDGDPVMVIGFKQTGIDPSQSSVRVAAARAAVASLPPRPLLIFPIAAERRPQTGLLNLS